MFGIPILWDSAIRLDESVATGRPMGDGVTPGGFWHYFKEQLHPLVYSHRLLQPVQ